MTKKYNNNKFIVGKMKNKSSRNKSNCVIIYKIWMGSLKIEDKFQWLLSNSQSDVVR